MARTVLSSDADLKRLFDRIITDILNAGSNCRLHAYFETAFAEYRDVITYTPGFWGLTEHAVRETTMICLSRIYDQHEGALGLPTLLRLIKAHSKYFDVAEVKNRVGKAYAMNLKQILNTLDLALLEADIARVSVSDSMVEKVVLWRSNFGAHTSLQPLLKRGRASRIELSRANVAELIDRALEIFNRYFVAFIGASYPSKVIHDDDATAVFELLRLGIQSYDSESRTRRSFLGEFKD